jgi:hypothetical protein
MRRTNVRRSKAAPFRSEPDFGQRPRNGVEVASHSDGCNVLQEEVADSQVANGIPEGEEESRPLAPDAGPESGQAEVLTGETADSHVRTASEQAEGE